MRYITENIIRSTNVSDITNLRIILVLDAPSDIFKKFLFLSN